MLASLTATMALEYMSGDCMIARAAEIIMDALPICRTRRISYSTFSIVDAAADGTVRLIEYANPPVLLIRDGAAVEIGRIPVGKPRWGGRVLHYAEIKARAGDRLVLVSDGITQAGLGRADTPLGWGYDQMARTLTRQLEAAPDLSARDLSQFLLSRAIRMDGDKTGDDMTCACIYFRRPRPLLLLTGPPFYTERDAEVARYLERFDGRKAVCGGTTSDIIARELKLPVSMDMGNFDPEIPNTSIMPGIDLVSEGCVTLAKVAEILESGVVPSNRNGATRLVDLIQQSDQIEFVVGTAVNPAHQDPCLPMELDIRRNVLKRILRLLETKYLKETKVTFI